MKRFRNQRYAKLLLGLLAVSGMAHASNQELTDLIAAARASAANMENDAEFRALADRVLSMPIPNKARLKEDRLNRVQRDSLAGGGDVSRLRRKNIEMDDQELLNLYRAIEELYAFLNEKSYVLVDQGLGGQLLQKLRDCLTQLPNDKDIEVVAAPDSYGMFNYLTSSEISGFSFLYGYLRDNLGIDLRDSAYSPVTNLTTATYDRLGKATGATSIRAQYIKVGKIAQIVKEYFAREENKDKFMNFADAVIEYLDGFEMQPSSSHNFITNNSGRLFLYHVLLEAGYDHEDVIAKLFQELRECTSGNNGFFVEMFNLVLNNNLKRLLYGSQLLEELDVLNSHFTSIRALAEDVLDRNVRTQHADPAYTELQSIDNSLRIKTIRLRLTEMIIPEVIALVTGDATEKNKAILRQTALHLAREEKRKLAEGTRRTVEGYDTGLDQLIEKEVAKLDASVIGVKQLAADKGKTILPYVDGSEEKDALVLYRDIAAAKAQELKAAFVESNLQPVLQRIYHLEEAVAKEEEIQAQLKLELKAVKKAYGDAVYSIIRVFFASQARISTIKFDLNRPDSVAPKHLTIDLTRVRFAAAKDSQGIVESEDLAVPDSADSIRAIISDLRTVISGEHVVAEQAKVDYLATLSHENALVVSDLPARDVSEFNEVEQAVLSMKRLEAISLMRSLAQASSGVGSMDQQEEISRRRAAAQAVDHRLAIYVDDMVVKMQEFARVNEGFHQATGLVALTRLAKAANQIDISVEVAAFNLDTTATGWNLLKARASQFAEAIALLQKIKDKLSNDAVIKVLEEMTK